MRIVISGSSGLIGSALRRSFESDGVEVRTLVRRPPRGAQEIEWMPGERPLDPDVLSGADAVIALGGASVGRLPWTRRYRAELRRSRILPTRTLATALRALGADAPAFVSASAVGFYGSAPGEELTEAAPEGDTFLARICVEWEDEARRAGENVALARTAPVIHSRGVLKPMIRLTRLGLAGPLGGGGQLWPWISLEDEVRALRHIVDARITGPVNLAGPVPATANETGRALGQRLHRPFWLPAPAWALRLGLSADAADSLLLADAHVRPAVLESTGFVFAHRTVQQAIAAAL
ncbi:TIGR01777 family oxidoreductase [Microbacterium sp.]|uniref:TIGR01777 family oxidoreductase n=1 Tax=Microbacterium sp. TaxID=51671 RepID=UPI0039E23A08